MAPNFLRLVLFMQTIKRIDSSYPWVLRCPESPGNAGFLQNWCSSWSLLLFYGKMCTFIYAIPEMLRLEPERASVELSVEGKGWEGQATGVSVNYACRPIRQSKKE